MIQFTHGGDIETGREYYSGEILDFSANINPLGMPASVVRAAQQAIPDSDHYPDPLCRRLRQAIAEKEGLLPSDILCGGGAADLIFRLALALRPRRALVLAPTFSEYEQALQVAGCQVIHHRLLEENQFDVTDAILDDLTEGMDLLWLCNPNNPSGRIIEAARMDRILEVCRQKHIVLAVDECFLDLCIEGKSLAGRLREMPNLFLLRAFTKSFAMPGLRLGYGLCSDSSLLDKMARCGPPWSASVPALEAGLAALDEEGFLEEARQMIARERRWLIAALRSMGFWVCESSANYLLFREDKLRDLLAALRQKGILIRSCGNYEGLDQRYYRVAVRQHDENEQMIHALKQCLEERK